ncbi:MAG: hypothetical protein FWF82_06355, partial [Oscillospiraceae bacterium]|nr:hypothetical protein [Oscillospiraceae bacterium]
MNRLLEQDKVYTVTVKAGLPSCDGAILEEDYTFSFTTDYERNSKKDYMYLSNGIAETFLPGDPALVELYCSANLLDSDFDLKLYQFGSADAYKKALNDYVGYYAVNKKKRNEEEFVFPVAGMAEVYSSSDKLARTGDDESGFEVNYYYNKPSFILLPNNLSEGWYLADISVTLDDEEFQAQKLIQINPVSVFSTSLPNEVYFFVNDTNTKKAASGAKISVEIGGKNYKADVNDKGIAYSKLNSDKKAQGVLTITYGTHRFMEIFDCRESTERTPEEDYYVHIYTDRNVYRTTDEVFVWGMVLPRRKDAAPLNDLRLSFGTETWLPYSGIDYSDESIPIKLNKDGTFTARFDIVRNVESYYSYFDIRLMTGDLVLQNKNIGIRDFDKPLYVFDVEAPDYTWMPHLNPVKFGINAAFYEGTPAEGLKFSTNYRDYNYNDNKTHKEVVTDKDGHADVQFTLKNSPDDTWRPQSLSVYFSLAGVENDYQSQYRQFMGFFRDVMLESEFKNGSLTVKTSMVDTTDYKPVRRVYSDEDEAYFNSKTTGYYRRYLNYYSDYDWTDFYNKYESYEDYDYYNHYYYDYGENLRDTLRGNPVDTTITGTLKRSWFEKTQKGNYYDFIQKENVITYNYEYKTETVGTYSLNTVDGEGIFENIKTDIPDSSYYMELSWYDTLGQPVKETVYLYNGESENSYYYWRDRSINNYSLFTENTIFTDNQTINFQLRNNLKPEKGNSNSRIFYAANVSEYVSADVADSTEFDFTVNDSHIPNFYFSSAYFDGRYVYPILIKGFGYNASERELTLEVTADKSKYSPSGKATVTVTARDKNGNAFPNAAVNLSVVDEATFAVCDQSANTLNSLYANIYSPRPYITASHVQHSLFGKTEPGAKGGGGGDSGSTRRVFKDNAAFLTGTTDANGKATFTFTLPDNLTSWRLTAQAAGKDSGGTLYAGDTKSPLIVTQPFFLTVNSLPQYILGDDVSISVRCNGQYNENTVITARIVGKDDNDTDISGSGKSNESINFGKLPKGEYIITASAKSGANSDAIELTVEVVDTILETSVTKNFNLDDLISGKAEINPL